MGDKTTANPMLLSLISLLLLLGLGFLAWHFLLNPNGGEDVLQSANPSINVKVYFAEDVAGGGYATKDIRLIKDMPLQEALPDLVAKMNRAALTKKEWSWWPESLVVRSVYQQKNGSVILDFEKQVQYNHRIGAFEEFLLVKSIVKTLMEYRPEVKSVRLLVGGQETDTLIGHVDITRPFTQEDL